MNAVLKGGVPPTDSAGPHVTHVAAPAAPGDVNTVPGGMTCPAQPRNCQTGPEYLPAKNIPRGSCQASPLPCGVSVPPLVITARGAISDITEWTSTSKY